MATKLKNMRIITIGCTEYVTDRHITEISMGMKWYIYAFICIMKYLTKFKTSNSRIFFLFNDSDTFLNT